MTQYEVLIENKSMGKIWNISPCVRSANYKTKRTGSPGTLELEIVKRAVFDVDCGDTVRFSVNGTLVFYGWIFSTSRDRWGTLRATCYDRLRYLKASASYTFYAQSAGQIISQIAADLQITTGAIADTGYLIPSLVEEEQTCLDIIGDAVDQTLLNTGRLYTFYDDGNGLALAEAGSMLAGTLIGDKSNLTEYTLKDDIDSQTYNSVKLARPNEETGRTDVFIAQDSSTIAAWGLLQLYQSVDGDLNDAQIQAQAASTLAFYNRPTRTLQISALGVVGLRAGQMAYLKISTIEDLAAGRYVLIEQADHTFENQIHTMDLEIRIL